MKINPGSMDVNDDPAIDAGLNELQSQRPIDHVIETGTYLGTGSTRILSEFFVRNKRPPKRFITIESNWTYWRQARKNLRHFPFVKPYYGLTLDRRTALDFIRRDPAILEHHRWPDIFIDDVTDPVGFYTRELFVRPPGVNGMTIAKNLVKRALWHGENLLPKLLTKYRDRCPLIVLDSAGGLGYLEFKTTLEAMGDFPYSLFLDDISHLKHFRSFEHIRSDARFKIIRLAKDRRWLLADHN